jgi:sec-independent protein translocase protein TatB
MALAFTTTKLRATSADTCIVFDFSIGEMLVVGTVALVVIGPERLPGVARTVGALLARAQRYVNNVKADIQREVELDNLKRLHAEMNEAGRQIMSEVKSGVEEVHASLGDVARSVETAVATENEKSAAVQMATATQHADPIAEKQYDLFGEVPASAHDSVPPVLANSVSTPERDRR